MLQKYGLVFYKVGEILDGLVVACISAKQGENLPDLSKLSPQFRGVMEKSEKHREDVLKMIREKFDSELPKLRYWLNSVNLVYSVKGLGYAEQEIARSPTFSTIERVIDELKRRIEDELDSVWFVHVSSSNMNLYRARALFGDNVATNFPTLTFDIEHAGTCLALNEGTACVMHLMRVVEGAISAVASGTGVPLAAVQGVSAWEMLLNLIRDRIRENNKTKIPSWEASRQFFEDSLAYFHAVKDAWRNPSMHLDKKYIDVEAKRIFNAVKSLMEHLGEHLDQSGTFRV